MRNAVFAWLATAIVAAGAASTGLAAQQAGSTGDEDSWEPIADQFGGAKSETRPSRDVTMSFTFATEVRQILVQGGQHVKAGDLLAKARDAEIVAALEQQRSKANSDLSVKVAEKQKELAQVRKDKVDQAGQAASPIEREERRVELDAADLQLQQAVEQHDEERWKLAQLEGSYERYKMVAPFDGVVEEVMIEVGQAVRETDPAIHLVNTDKLWLDAYADTHLTMRLNLSKGDEAWVLMDTEGAPTIVKGRVLYVSPVANAVSQSRRVRVEIDNPANLPAGLRARVRFQSPPSEFAKFEHQPQAAAAKPAGDAPTTNNTPDKSADTAPAPATASAGGGAEGSTP